jgi:bifunctional non-homologous end joining protein LigD
MPSSTARSCLDVDGKSNFRTLLLRRDWPHFYAFDVLAVNGEDLTTVPLLDRKHRLREIMPRMQSRLLYVDHLASSINPSSPRRTARIAKR